jgi:hypothetical protein
MDTSAGERCLVVLLRKRYYIRDFELRFCLAYDKFALDVLWLMMKTTKYSIYFIKQNLIKISWA